MALRGCGSGTGVACLAINFIKIVVHESFMTARTVTLNALYEAIREVQRKLDRLAGILVEDEELSDAALEALQRARETPEEEYVPLE